MSRSGMPFPVLCGKETAMNSLFDGRSNDLLKVRAWREHETLIVELAGEIDLATTDLLRWALRAAENLIIPPHPLVIDLRGVTFLNSSGLGQLIECARRCAVLAVSLRLVADGNSVIRPINLLGLAPMLPVYADMEDAVLAL
ncbi:anti-sigma factor antagonist [Pseudonocardiaceae bacterium YIM PH 21723]|nr:anti-sigma factor antagonist [Pseudonocardiaceae bacterium YIM PH 21723]